MKYTLEKYKILAERFNKQSFTAKLITIKANPDLFSIETDAYNIRLRLLDEEAMNQGVDLLFSFPDILEFEYLKDIFKLVNINVKTLPI